MRSSSAGNLSEFSSLSSLGRNNGAHEFIPGHTRAHKEDFTLEFTLLPSPGSRGVGHIMVDSIV